ncbi:MAG: NAD(P)-dependent oxidoreductase [Chloroflexi bacterium]|nr:NAD(P)-dependent oxidoreductase [Chloroflexota bacterium]
MRVLVTGATGFIGRLLVPQLVARKDTAVTLLLLENQSGAPLPPPLNQLRPQFHVVYADLRNFQLTLRAVQEAQPDNVIHLAAAGTTNPFLPVEQALRHNVTGALNLIRACFEKTAVTHQLIMARTPGERSAMNTYAASKAAAWQFARMYGRTQGWPIHGGMVFQAYGPGQPERAFVPAAFRAALAGEDFPMTAGAQQRDWIFGADVAAGLTAMLDAPLEPGTTVELGTGQATPLADVAQLIYDVAGCGGRPLPNALPSRPGEEASQIANAEQTAGQIHWQAATSLSQGLRALYSQIKTGAG